MGKGCILTIINNLKNNILLLFSTAAALCLFLTLTPIYVAFIASVYIVVAIAVGSGALAAISIPRGYVRIYGYILALVVDGLGFYKFYKEWISIEKVGNIASKLGISSTIFLGAIGLIMCIAGFYAVLTITRGILYHTKNLLQNLIGKDNRENAGLKSNWIFPISAFAFYFLNASLTAASIGALIISFILSLYIATLIPSVWGYFKKGHIGIRVFSMLSAAGICLAARITFCIKWATSPTFLTDVTDFNTVNSYIIAISILCAVVAVPFLYVCMHIFSRKMISIIKETALFRNLTTGEICLYSLLLIILTGFVTFVYLKTTAFFGTREMYDTIYTSDSPYFIRGNVYLYLTHPQNDIRQPLFAVFAAPFCAIPYLLGRVLQLSTSLKALLLNFVQIGMLFSANFILSRILRLSTRKRVCFMILSCFMYTQMLFTFMMEQYIVAYFWLTLCVYLFCENRRRERFALVGAGGTMLTSLVILPFLSENSPIHDFKKWFRDVISYGMEFLTFMVLFFRFDIIYSLLSNLKLLSNFTGVSVGFTGKLYQYISFVSDCFIAPNAGIDKTTYENISWQLSEVTGVSIIGVIILFLCAVSAWLNRDKMSSRFAAGWIGFSFVILFILGWGTSENGLILYTLYFGWAFLVLLFQLVEKAEDKCNSHVLIPTFTAIGAAIMAFVNIPAIYEMIQFAIRYYPV